MGNKRRFGGSVFLLFIWVLGLVCALRSADIESMLDRPVRSFRSINESAVSAILRFGREARIPLGIVLNRQLCSASFGDVEIDRAPGRAVLDRIGEAMPAYHWRLEHGTVVFVPFDMPAAADQFLSVPVSPYSVPDGTLQAQAAYEWMNIRASLRPTEGTAFDVLSSAKSTRWPPLRLGRASVREVLDRLVGRDPGGAWILFPVDNLEQATAQMPLQFVDYSAKGPTPSPCSGPSDPSGRP